MDIDFSLGRLHHIGVVVRNTDAALKEMQKMKKTGSYTVTRQFVSTQKVNVSLIREVNNCAIEFVEPCGFSSPVYTYAQNGGGLHHLCFEVDDVYEALINLKEKGKVIVKPTVGLDGKLIAFMWLKTDILGFSLIELMNKKS